MNSGSPHNPFAASDLEPYTTPYVFPEERALSYYVAQLVEHGWNAELIGPHGVGKSTLLYTLAASARTLGKRVVHFRCSDVNPQLPLGWQLHLLGSLDLVCLDGAERISPRQFRSLQSFCRHRGIGLLSTAHFSMRDVLQLPIASSTEQLSELLQSLNVPPAFRAAIPNSCDLLAMHQGCVRDALLELYDLYENWHLQRRCSPQASVQLVKAT